MALHELGQDYLKAGLLDRAEESFERLAEGPYRGTALKNLLDIYQQEKDWEKAISAAREFERDSGQSWQKEIANFYCELAAVEINHSRSDRARAYLQDALAANRKCVRASILLGDIEAAEGNHEAAIEAWKRIETQNPSYLALVAQRMLKSFQALGETEHGLTLLRGYLVAHPSLDLLDVVFQLSIDAKGAQAAYELVRDELRRNPTLLGLDRLLEAQLLTASAERRPDLEMVRGLVHSHTRKLSRYRCESCGFRARQFYWQCPACGGWETFPPVRSEEFELAS